MFNIVYKLIIIIFSLFYLIPSANAMNLIDEENAALDLEAEIFKKKLLKNDLKSFTGTIIFNVDAKLKSKINNSIDTISHIKNEFHLNEKIEDKIVLSKLKLGYFKIIHNKYGSLSYGKDNGIMKSVLEVSDEVPYFNNSSNKFDYFMLNRSENLISYENENLFNYLKGFKFGLQYQGKNPAQYLSRRRRLVKYGNGQGYGFLSSYNFKKISILGSFFKSKRTREQMEIREIDQLVNKYASAYAYACKYNSKNLYLSALYGKSFNLVTYGRINNTYIRRVFREGSVLRKYYYCGFAPQISNLELVSKYRFNCGIQPHISYMRSFAESVKNDMSEYFTNFISFGMNYIHNKNISMFVDYKINLLKSSDFINECKISTKNCFAMGFKYKF